jgi:zinc protease
MSRVLRLLTILVVLSMATAAQAIEIKVVKAPLSGVTAWLVEDHTNPIISMSLAWRGGAALDPVGKEGLANLVASTLDEGAGDMDSQAYQGRMEDIASSIRFRAGLDDFTGTFATLTQHADEALEMLRLALIKPRFDDPAVDRVRRQIAAQLRRDSENPRSIANRKLMELQFPNHPYSRDARGTPETLPVIKVVDLRAFVSERLARDNLIIGVVGDIAPDQLALKLDKVFQELPEHAKPWTLPPAKVDAADRVLVVDKHIPQSVIRWSQPGILRNDPDFFVAYVMNYILGGGTFESRLTEEIREKRGLAYSTSSALVTLKQAGLLQGAADTRNEAAAQTVELMRTEWKKMATGTVTDAELADAKRFIVGSYALQFSSSGSIASILAGLQLDELGIDYIDKRAAQINAVTKADIKRVSQRILTPDKLTVVVVGEPKGIETRGIPSARE